MSVTDDLSGVNSTYLEVTDSDGSEINSGSGTSLSLSGLDDGDYTVNYEINDNAGNWNNNSWSFTVDTSYNGASTVDFEYDDGYTYLMDDDNDDFSFDVSLGDSADEGADIRLTCYAGSVDESNEFDQTDFENVDSEGYDYSCEIPGDEYSDQPVDVVVEACDEAGNCEEVGQTTYNMDLSPPYITDFQQPDELSTFNSEFQMSFDASDAATSVSQVEYFFDDDSLSYGDGTEVDTGADEFTVDTSGLESGSHTLYLRAQDEAGRWSDAQSFEFEYYPNQDPEVSLTVPESLDVTAGESEEFDVTVENTGEFLIESVNLEVSSDVLSAEESLADMEPGDSLSFTFEAAPSESDIGEYDVQVSTDSPSASQSFSYRIRANQQQQSSIQSDLDEQVERLERIESNITSLQQKVSKSRSQALSSNLSEFKSSVEEAQSAVESGEYYRAQKALENVDSQFDTAQTTYQNVKEQHQKSQRFKMIIVAIFLFLAAIGGAIGYLIYDGRIDPEEVRQEIEERIDGVDLDLDSGSDGGDDSSGPGIITKIKLMLEGNDSEAEEFEWDGFRDE